MPANTPFAANFTTKPPIVRPRLPSGTSDWGEERDYADDEWAQGYRSRSARYRYALTAFAGNKYVVRFAIAILAVALLAIISHRNINHIHTLGRFLAGPEQQSWVKPENITIIAMIFMGRPHTVDILDCYLQQNLVINGGYLDEVHFMQHTQDPDDLAWFATFFKERPFYKVIDEEGITKFCHSVDDNGEPSCKPTAFGDVWKHATQNDTIYIKIDDDIIYMHGNAIPSLIHTLLRYPDAQLINANVVNNALANWPQAHLGAVHPYLPEPSNSPTLPPLDSSPSDWRVGDLPDYPADLKIRESYDWVGQPFTSENYKQRMLPLPDTTNDLLKTPIGNGAEYHITGRAWRSWAVAQQELYSLLKNIEQGTLSRYYYGSGEDGTWDTLHEQYSINMMAIRGETVAERVPQGQDDEVQLTVRIPKELNKRTLVDTRSLVAHLHYHPQNSPMMKTDVLDRYRLLANEAVCRRGNQKHALA